MAFNIVAQLQLQTNTASLNQIANQVQQALRGAQLNVQVGGLGQLQQLQAAALTAQVSIKGLGASVAGLAGVFTATALGVRSLGSAFADAARDAVAFDQQLNRLAQLGTVQDEIRGVSAEITRLSSNFGASSKDLSQAAVRLKELGISAADTNGVLQALAQASLSPNFKSMGEAVTGSVAAMKSFGLAATDLQGVLGSVAAVAESTGASSDELFRSIEKGGAVFHALGGSVSEYLATIASVKSVTQESSDSIAAGLSRVFSRIQKPETITALEQLGISLRDVNGQLVGPLESIRRLQDGLSGLSATDARFSAVVDKLGGARQSRQLVPLLQNTGDLQRQLNVASFAPSTAAGAATAQDAYLTKIQKTREEFASLGRSILQDTSVKQFADTLFSAASAGVKLVDSLKPLIPLLLALSAARAASGVAGLVGGIGGRAGLGLAAGLGAASFIPGAVGGTTGQGLQGAFNGAVTGGAIGSAFGPLGIAVGSVTGGLYGMASALDAAKKSIEEAKLSTLKTEQGSLLADLASGARPLSESNLGNVASNNNALLLSSANRGAENYQESRGFFGRTFGTFDVGGLRSQQNVSAQQTLGPTLANLAQTADLQIRQLARQPGASGQSVFGGFAASDFGRSAISTIARGSGRSQDDVANSFRRSAESAVMQSQASDQASAALSRLNASVTEFAALGKAVSGASASLSDLENKGRFLADIFSGNAGAIPIPGVVNDLKNIGGPNAGRFGNAVDVTTSGLGAPGEALSSQAKSLDQLTRILPDILREQISGRSVGADDDLGARVRSALERSGNILPSQIEDVTARINKEDPLKFLASLQEKGSEQTASTLSKSVGAPVETALTDLATNLNKRGNDVVQALATNADLLRKTGESQFRADELNVNVLRNQAARQAEAIGQPGSALDRLSLAQLQTPLQRRQEQLTGLNGEAAVNPSTVVLRLNQTVARADAARQARDQAPAGSEQFNALSSRFQDLNSQAGNLRQALINLTDAASRNATVQEKINKLEEDRSSRLSFGEKFLTADAGQQSQINRGLVLSNVAATQGNLDSFGVSDRKLILDTLHQLGNSKLTGVEGSPVASDLVSKLVRGSAGGVFDLSGPDQKERGSLQDIITSNFEKAQQAQGNLVDLQKELQVSFYNNLEGINAKFLTELKAGLLATQVQQQKAQLDSLLQQKQPIAARAGQADFLQSLGVNDNVLSLLKSPKNLNDLQAIGKAQSEDTRLSGIEQRGIQGTADFTAYNNRIVNGQLGAGDIRSTIISDFLQQNNLGHLDANAVSKNFHDIYANSGEREQAQSAGDIGKLNSLSNDFLQQALQTAIAGAARQRSTAIVADQSALAERSGISSDVLEKVFASLQDNGTKLVDALKAVDGIQKASDQLSKINEQLGRVTDSIQALQGGGNRQVDPNALIGAVGGGLGAVANIAGGPPGFSKGGSVGTDTIPAMLTPGEFVVNRSAAQKNMGLLAAINGQHLADGGVAGPDQLDIAKQAFANPGSNAALFQLLLPLLLKNGVGAFNGSPLRGLFSQSQSFGSLSTQQQAANARDPFARFGRGRADFGAQRAIEQRLARGRLDVERQFLPDNDPGVQQFFRRGLRPAPGLPQGGGFGVGLGQQAIGGFGVGLGAPDAVLGGLPAAVQAANGVAGALSGGVVSTVGGAASILEKIKGAAGAALSGPEAPPAPEAFDRTSGFLNSPTGFARGGLVPGTGTGDSVPAMLSPGEYVLSRSDVAHFAAGGLVGGSTAGPSSVGLSPEVVQSLTSFGNGFSSAVNIFGSSSRTLQDGFSRFTTDSALLAEALKSIPSKIDLSVGKQTVEVVLNGGEVLARIQPELQSYVEDMVKTRLAKAFKDNLPDAPSNFD